MRRTRIAALATAGALAAAGTGVAVATSASDDAKQREQAVLEDAASRLDVDADELRDALGAAEDAQLDAEVKAGRLTQAQADAIKQIATAPASCSAARRPRPGGPLRHSASAATTAAGRARSIGAAAKALGISERSSSRSCATASRCSRSRRRRARTTRDVKAAMRAAVKTELDEAVKDGRLTQAQADDMLEHLTDRLDDGGFGRGPGGPPRGGFGPGGPDDDGPGGWD